MRSKKTRVWRVARAARAIIVERGRGSLRVFMQFEPAIMSAVGATKEVLLDQFRKLSEKEQHDHILSLLELVEVRQELRLNFSSSALSLPPSLCRYVSCAASTTGYECCSRSTFCPSSRRSCLPWCSPTWTPDSSAQSPVAATAGEPWRTETSSGSYSAIVIVKGERVFLQVKTVQVEGI